MKFSLIGQNSLASQLKSAVNSVAKNAHSSVKRSIKDLAEQARDKARDWADSRLYTTRDQYKDAISLEKIDDDTYVLILDASAVHLDQGYGSYDMKPGLLKNVTRNSGKKGQGVSKEGYRYKTIPFQNSQAPAKSNHPLHNRAVQHTNTVEDREPGEKAVGKYTQGELSGSIKDIMAGIKREGIELGSGGGPGEEFKKVATVEKDEFNELAVRVNGKRLSLNKPFPALLNGLNIMSGQVGGKTKNAYVTFRVVSENPNSKAKFIHPGYIGCKIMEDVEKWSQTEISKILEEYLKAS